MRKRLDEALVERGLAPTRSRARDLVRRGAVRVGGTVASKPGAHVEETAEVLLDRSAGAHYVSRGALKLIAALDAFGFDVAGRTALDAGASTGGFTQVLLERGARIVHAVDVGRGQLHPSLRIHPDVRMHEGTDVRTLDRSSIGDPLEAIVADLSFISLPKVLPGLMDLAAPGAWLVALVKPQFEAGPDAVGKGGIVRDPAVRERAAARVAELIATTPCWTVEALLPSPIAGGSGNQELLVGATFHG